jgi:hypothetical protein
VIPHGDDAGIGFEVAPLDVAVMTVNNNAIAETARATLRILIEPFWSAVAGR